MPTIRAARPSDNTAISRVQVEAIHALCQSHYEPRQLEAWAARRTPEFYARVLESQELFVADEDGAVVGFGQLDLESGQVMAVYVAPEAARRGVGTAILRHLEEMAKMHGWYLLHLTASLNAVPFYEQMGYEAVGPFVHHVASDVELPCVNMRKQFPKDAA